MFGKLPQGTKRVEPSRLVGSTFVPSMLVQIELDCFDWNGVRVGTLSPQPWTHDSSPMSLQEAEQAIRRLNLVLASQ